MHRHNHGHLFNLAEMLSEPPSGGWIQRWLLGVFVATGLTVWGITAFVTATAWILNVRLRGMAAAAGLFREVHGDVAVSAGLFLVGAGMFAHVHWFWGTDKRLQSFYGWYELGKVLAVFVVLIAIGRGVWASMF